MEVCTDCAKGLAMVIPSVAKQLLGPVVTTAASRYAGRTDEASPTMVLPEPIMELAVNVFNSGRFRTKAHFSELVKKYMALAPAQHERLFKDLQSEPFFNNSRT